MEPKVVKFEDQVELKDVEVFRAGTYPQGVFTNKDLKDMADGYDVNLAEAPITIDHDGWGPAFGWVSSVTKKGSKLFADMDVTPEFAQLLKNKSFKKRSIEIFSDFEKTGTMYVKAVTFLGAAPPQVKGMKDIVFAEDCGDSVSVEFSDEEESIEPIEPVEQLKEEDTKKGLEDMFKDATLELLKQHRPDLFAEIADQTTKEFLEMDEKNEKFEEVEAKVVELNEQVESLTAERDTALAARDTMKTAADEAANKAAMAETKTAIESLLSESELPKPSVERIAKQFADAVNVDGLDEAIADAKAFLEELGTTGVQVSGMGETEDQDDAENTLLASRADAIVAEKGCDYGTALIEAGAK